MSIIEDTLKFYFSPVAFKQTADAIIPVTLIKQQENRIKRLQKITEDIGESSFSFPKGNAISQAFLKFKKSILDSNISFDRRELRTLTYSINHNESDFRTIFSNEHELEYLLLLLNRYWRDSFFIGIFDCYLKNWETKDKKSLIVLEKFILQKLETYSGNRKTILSIKNNSKFFNIQNGNLLLGDFLSKSNKTILDATKILGVPESWISYPYFSMVIVTYYEKQKEKAFDEINNLTDFLIEHNYSKTNKRLISKLIILANNPQYQNYQDIIKNLAIKFIGDPAIPSNWSPFENATESERFNLLEARNIFEEWIAKQFIDIFFRICINDDRRKKFWLNIASKNRITFKVYGSASLKLMLKHESKINNFLNNRFIVVESKKNISAFVLYVGNYILIEFSDAGYAFYAYKSNGMYKPNLSSRMDSVDELRNGNLPYLAYRTGNTINEVNEEGRLSHKDGDLLWEDVFKYWFRFVAKINV